MAWAPPGVEVNTPEHWPLAKGKVKHVGRRRRRRARRRQVRASSTPPSTSIVEYDPLPVVIDPEAALEDGSPLVHEEFGTNKIARVVAGRRRRRGRRSPTADVVVERRIVNHRTAGAAIEPRGVLAD